MRIRDWSSDVCSSDLRRPHAAFIEVDTARRRIEVQFQRPRSMIARRLHKSCRRIDRARRADGNEQISLGQRLIDPLHFIWPFAEEHDVRPQLRSSAVRSEEHTSELQSLMRISYAVFCVQKKNSATHTH